MKRVLIPIVILVTGVLVVLWPRLVVERTPLPTLWDAPSFDLIDSHAQPFSSSQLQGKIWVIDFFFTTCAGPCPAMAQNMSSLYRAYEDESRVRFVSVTVNPEYDSPDILRKYAARLKVDPDKWHFLTGEAEAIHELSLKGFKMGSPEALINHSQQFVLVDAMGRLRGVYRGTDEEATARLQADIKRLLRESTS